MAAENRSICVALERPADRICLLASRSRGMDDRCLLHQLGVHQGLCISAIQSNREFYPEDAGGSIPADASLRVLVQPTLVPVAAVDNSRYTECPAIS